ncbi:MAG: hypothetical protein LBJ69_04055 [Holosporales bacterium]|jgi:hypothetical protein|nr:hypothetical protein [Holosporales bacterium]
MCYRSSRGVWKWWSSRERERESPVVERKLVPTRTLFLENRELKSEVETLKQRIGTLELLLGIPPKEATRTEEAQAPTGIFLFTHQQWLIHGAMQFARELSRTAPFPGYVITTINRLVQQQLDKADSETTIQLIESEWVWRVNAYLTSVLSVTHAYATAERQANEAPRLCAAKTSNHHHQVLGYECPEGVELDNTTAIPETPYDISIPEVARVAGGDFVANELTRYAIEEFAALQDYSNTYDIGEDGRRVESQAIGMSQIPTASMTTIRTKLRIRWTIRQVVNSMGSGLRDGGAYVIYQRPLPPKPAQPPA